ncbi:MAG: PAS domain S-box protein [Bacteroidetes bacterium]|nr:PAS domain S-box protein [Bacteroidota bacterium]
MQENLFNLSFDRWELLLGSLLPALINAAIFIYASFFLPRNRTNYSFSLFVIMLAIGQMSDGLMRMSNSHETALEWCRLSLACWVFTIPFGLLFVLYFTGLYKKLNVRVINFFLFTPPVLLELLIMARFDSFRVVKSSTWNWIANPEPSLVDNTIFIWLSVTALLMMSILWFSYFKLPKDMLKKKQALLLAGGMTLPVLGGIIAEVIFPMVLKMDDIPITTPLVTLFSISSLIAITKFNLLDYSPKHQWGQIVESMNEGILIVNNEDRIMYANKMFCTTLEYELGELKGKGASDLLLSTPEQKEQVKKAIAERLEKKSGKYEIQLTTKSGKKIWVLINGSPYLDRNGKVIGSIGLQTNITHLKETDLVLRQSESRLKQAQSISHIGSWEVNLASGKVLWSDEACRIHGLSPEENEHTVESWLSFIHPDDLDFVKEEIKKSKSEFKGASFFHRIVHKDGTVKHIHSESRFEFGPDGKPIGLHGLCHDVTDRKKVQDSLSESEQRMRTFINESLMSIYFVDPETKRIIYANPSFLQLLGYSKEEIDSVNIYEFVNHSKENIDGRISETLKGKKVSLGEREWKSKAGRIIHVIVSTFYQNMNGEEIIYVAAQDISERKKMEVDLKTTNNELETFIYKASHDLRGPLTSILGLVILGKRESKDETQIKMFDYIGTKAKALDSTLTDLLKLMHIKNVDIEKEMIDIERMIANIIGELKFMPEFSRINISTSVQLPGHFTSNKVILETIFQNLISNAIKYQDVRNEDPFLKISIFKNGSGTKFVFSDNGIGINEAIQPKVFDMYFRGTQVSKGSGLGLYLVKKGVEKLNGSIEYSSIEGIGTTFTVIL